MNGCDQDILILIAARLCGEELTEKDNMVLERWRQADPAHEELYHYYEDFFARKSDLSVWEKIRSRGEKSAGVFRSRLISRDNYLVFVRYAAIVVPVILGACWLISRHWDQPLKEPVRMAVQEDFAPGKQKAQLRLENGEVIALSDSSMAISSHQNIKVGNGGVLQYAGQMQGQKTEPVYHTLVVDRGAEFQLKLPDGTRVWLNSDSELKYPSIFSGDTRQVFLKGEAFFEVRHIDCQPFVVHTGECDIRVIGTAFNVASYPDEAEVLTTLVNGKVAYSAGRSKGTLVPGEQCVYNKSGKTVTVREVDVDQYISWKNGLFVFEHIRMEELAKQISRWYGINVVFPDQGVRQISFTGAMERYKPVSYIIQLLNETNTVECKMEGDMLVFRKK